jgi:Asp-tRNA(Asn)/Glu-tRNA(Gln) amidotransferase A subunit family amidase
MKQVNTVNNATSAINNPMAKAKASLVKVIAISTKTVDLLTNATKKQLGVAKTKKQTVDALEAEGVKSFMLDLPEKGKKSVYADLHIQMKQAIVLGFEQAEQDMLAKETKTLSDFDKKVKRAIQQQVGSEFAYYRRALAKREAPVVDGDSEKSTPVEMYFKDLQSALDRLTKLENMEFDLVQHTSAIKKLLADK